MHSSALPCAAAAKPLSRQTVSEYEAAHAEAEVARNVGSSSAAGPHADAGEPRNGSNRAAAGPDEKASPSGDERYRSALDRSHHAPARAILRERGKSYVGEGRRRRTGVEGGAGEQQGCGCDHRAQQRQKEDTDRQGRDSRVEGIGERRQLHPLPENCCNVH